MAPTSPSISQKVLANAPSYRHIQASLADLRDAPFVLAYQAKRVKSLESDFSQAAESVTVCAEATKKEREEHERIRDSTVRKLAYKLTRRKEKYEEKASKEEREYVNALNREISERRRAEELAQTLNQAKTELDTVTRNMTQYTNLKSELWSLYDGVFDGEGDRRDIELKHQIDIADKTYRHLARQASDDTKVVRLLHEAQSKMKEARENVNKAVELTKWDINSNSAMSDQIKHNHLKAANAAGDKAKFLVRDARKLSADLGEMGEFTVPIGHMRMELFYVNPVFQAPSDESVREAGQSVGAAYKTLKAEFLSATQRAERSRADLDEAANVVNESRKNLEVYRQEVFDMVLLESQNDALPLYSNIMQT